MSIENKFLFIGHCFDPSENHDKIWGYFLRPGYNSQWEHYSSYSADQMKLFYGDAFKGRNTCTFWGRRGKAMQFKASTMDHSLETLKNSKLKKGYKNISQEKLFQIWPTFIEEAEGKLMWEILAGKIK